MAADGAPVTSSTGLFAHLAVYDANNPINFIRVASADFVTGPDVLLVGTIPTTFTSPITNIDVLVSADNQSWVGTLYIDDVRIE